MSREGPSPGSLEETDLDDPIPDPAPPPTIERLLLPVDGSDASDRAGDVAVDVADRYDATIHAIVVFDEQVAQGLEDGELSHDEVAERSEDFLTTVKQEASDAHVPVTEAIAIGFSATRKMDHPGSVILDCAEDAAADLLVVPRESVDDPQATLSKAAEYVVSYADQPVLSV